MPDEALLELVKQKLGVLGVSAARRETGAPFPTRAKGEQGAARETRRPARGRRAASPSPERREMLDEVERIVKAGSGVSASEVARSAGIPQTRAAAALKQLKLAKRIFQGGDRRFARYAGNVKTAEKASRIARRTAKGPVVTTGAPAPKPSSHDGGSVAKTPGDDGGSGSKAPGSTARPRKRGLPAAAAPAA
jgi:hypothetical protein